MRTISGQIFEAGVEINDSIEDTIYLNCTFKNNVSICSITSSRCFKFQECRIDGSFFTVSIHRGAPFIEINLSFSNSQINTLNIGKDSLQEYNFYIDIDNTYITNCKISCCTCNNINIFKSRVSDLLLDSCMWRNLENSCINIHESEFNRLYINRISYGKLNIVNSKLASLDIKDSSFINELKIISSIVQQDINVTLIYSKIFHIERSVFESKVNCEYSNEYKEKSKGQIVIKDIMIKEQARFVAKHNIFFDSIDITITPRLFGEISFIGFRLQDRLVLSGFNKNADLRFMSVSAHTVVFNGYMNWGTTSFLFLHSYLPNDKSYFACLGPTYMGNMIFDGSDLSSFTNIQILDSSLIGIKYTNLKWPSPERIVPYPTKDKCYWVKKREIYRQLKYCAEDNKDRIQALIFKSYELDAYQRTLNWQDNASDLLMLWLNKLSNNHGLSWIRGVMFTAITCFVFYFIFCLCQNDFFSKYFFWENLMRYFWLPNGIDDLISFLKSNSNIFIGAIGVISYLLGKIFIAYGIFQTISAFRKFVKN